MSKTAAKRGAFQKRLKGAKKSGGLRTAEIARWFDRPYATVYGWLVSGRKPDTVDKRDEAHINGLLLRLERRIRLDKRFKLRGLTRAQRAEIMKK